MLIVVGRFECVVDGNGRERVFTWYLADAPRELYEATARVPRVLGVARALLDCALQYGFGAGRDGAMLLHAAPEGGDRLLRFYEAGCGLVRIPPEAPRVSPARAQDGRYFHFDDEGGRQYAAEFDAYR
jgi:hypothetical protein